ncbi:uncharacterized protein LOC142238981 [Haematobia irritans]|uniref:uncharacterized protein LOC142238981 n=1 Tax=Haematobia irritans TaxID=7368 RepID=UPI003F50B922
MFRWMSHKIVTYTILAAVTVCVGAARYQLLFDNEDIFDKCDNGPSGRKGLDEFVDFSELSMEFSDGVIRVSGNCTFVWKDVEPDDYIQESFEVYKFSRGTWQPTVLTYHIKDACANLFEDNSEIYKFWTSHVKEEDRKCFTNYGHVFHHEPFEANLVMDFAGNMEGRYKIICEIIAYDKTRNRRPNSICYAVSGELIKI